MVCFDEELKKVNAQLKAGGERVSVLVRDNHLWLLATLPPKPSSSKTRPFQQKVSLGAKATVSGLIYAKRRAKDMSRDLDSGSFNWDDWIAKKIKTIGEVVRDYHSWVKKQKRIADTTFLTDYERPSQKLPLKEKININSIIEIIGKTEPGSRNRKRLAQYCARLCDFAQMPVSDINKIKSMVGNYSAKQVNPRELPEDEYINKIINNWSDDNYRWLLGIIATYGLRSHEAFHLEVIEYPKLRVIEGKTGARIVYPLYPEWVDKWNLRELRSPSINYENNVELSSRVASYFSRHHSKLGFRALDLRHCYARRCFEFGIEPDRACVMMGHSLNVHLTTYRAWFSEKLYDDVYRKAVSAGDSPTAPD